MSAAVKIRRGLAARHRRLVDGGDAGTTMIELFVAMIIMTICGAIFTTALISLYKATYQAQAITDSSTQSNQAFQTLDRSVRYAAAISAPGRSTVVGGSGDWYVELRNTTTGVERCTQLQADVGTGQLRRRTWTVNTDGTITTPTTWLPLASGLTNTSATPTADQPQPFVRKTLTPNASHQVLTVNLVTRSNPAAGSSARSGSSFDLTALNSVPSPSGSICQQAGRP